MGVPKFFRWLAERYPLVLQKVSAEPVDIDHLYLDMNGIIHNCTHANNAAKATASEDEMMHLVFQYIERLVRIAKPNKLLFMAIDGVAPRAKMNQQRSRRFRAGKERQEAEQRARRLGEELPAAGLFDSNCITPGTEFMYRLDKHLKFFIRRKLATDPTWAKLKVLYSGYDVPGEGEHKIMEFIRYEKVRVKQPAPNTRHCMYGLDADLILLSLATHEPHFCLLREEVAFNNKQRGQPSREVLEMKKDDFQLLHIGLLREYLREETYQPEVADSYDFERVVDDFVLLCVLVGNDFLPHSPTLDIGEGAMDVIFETYRNTLVRDGHHLTQGERISHVQLELLLAALAEKEADTLISRAEDQVAFENRRRRGAAPELMAVADPEGEEDGAPAPEQLFSAEPTMMGAEARTLLLSGDKDAGLASYKKRMYRKMHADDDDRVRTVVEWYMEGLHWVMQYYYRGVPSWSWFYPFHYAPFLSDMTDLQAIVCEFTQSEPVKPYQQLMMVMPTSSKELLPQPFHSLMDDPNSPIADFYPVDFEVDGEGKRADWEAVVLLPFIDFDRLLKAYNSKVIMLTPEAHSRNGIGKLYLFKYQKGSEETSFCQSTLPAVLPSITKSNSTVDEVLPKKPLPHGAPGFQPVLTKGCLTGSKALKVGWPSLHTVPFTTSMQSVGVNLLGIVSKRPTRVLKPDGADMDPGSTTVLNKVSYFRYPHLMRCKVVELTDGKSVWTAADGQPPQSVVLDKAQQERTASAISEAKSTLLVGKGVDASGCEYFFRVLRNVGMLRLRDGSLSVKFEDHGDYVPAPLLLETSLGIPAPHQDKSGPEVFQEGSQFVFRGLAHYGALATVQQCNTETVPVRYNILLKARNINFKSVTNRIRSARARAENAERWFPSFMVARRLGIESSTLGRMTGSCFVTVGEKSFDVGLSLRHGADLCVPDFACPAPEGKGWQYSAAAAQLMAEFQQKFPWVANLCTQSNSATLLVSDAFPELDAEAQISRAKAVQSWRSQSILNRMKLVPVTSNVASYAAVREMDTTFSAVCCTGVKQLEVLDVGSELLVPPLAPGISSEATASSVDVGDCLVFVGTDTGSTPPFGTLAVAVAVHEDCIDVLCAEKFASGSDLEGRVRKGYGARLGFDVLINLSDMSAAELSAPTAKPVAAGNAAKQQSAAATPAAPGIPDGTRGFHQQNGYGRGKPAGIKLTPQALLQAAGTTSMAPGATSVHPSNSVQQTASTTVQPPTGAAVNQSADAAPQPSAALPDFMMNILRHESKGPQTAALALPPAQPATHVHTAPGAAASSSASAVPQSGDDMIKKLLQAPKASESTGATVAPVDSAQSAQPAAAGDRSCVAPPTPGGAAREATWSPVRILRVASDAALTSMGFAERSAAIKKHVLQILEVSRAIFEGAGDQSLCSSAQSLAKDVESSGLTSNSIQQVCRCVQTAAQLLPPGEAAAFCSQADSIVRHATHCQSTEQQMKAGTQVSEHVMKLQDMDHSVRSMLRHAEHWCYLAASSRLGPPFQESEIVMHLCLDLQKARARSTPITRTLLDRLTQSVENLAVGYDSYVNSQRQQVRHALKEAIELHQKVVQQIGVLSQQVASQLLASCDALCDETQAPSAEQQQARQALLHACAQQSLPKQTVNACSAWISQIQRKNNAQTAALINLLSEAGVMSHMAEAYALMFDSTPSPVVPMISAATSGGGASRGNIRGPGAGVAFVPMMAPAGYVTGDPLQSAPQGPLASRDSSSHPKQSVETSASPSHAAHLMSQVTPTKAPVQQGAAGNGADLIARLFQNSSGASGGSGAVGQPTVSTVMGVSTVATMPESIIGVPVAQARPVPESDPMLAMWNDLQG